MSTILSQLKPLKIGDLTAKLPIIQGGMGVGISLSSLAGAVAGAGGIGIISTAQIGFREPDFAEHPQEANLRAIGSELQKARAIAKGGIVGFNIMVATKNYAEYVKTAVKAGADLIISGAGLPVSLPEYVKGTATKIAPIVSSVKAATVICRMWDRKYQTAPDLVVVEGPLAGGHLGFDREKLLTRIGLSGYRIAAIKTHLLCDHLIYLAALCMIPIKELQEACLCTGCSLGAKET